MIIKVHSRFIKIGCASLVGVLLLLFAAAVIFPYQILSGGVWISSHIIFSYKAVQREIHIWETLPMAEGGNSGAQARLARLYFRRHTDVGNRESVKWAELGAEQGNIEAMTLLASHYACGTGTEKNLSVSAKWYLAAAERGDVVSQYYVSRMYGQGIGVIANQQTAAYWWKKVEAAIADCPACDLPSGGCIDS